MYPVHRSRLGGADHLFVDEPTHELRSVAEQYDWDKAITGKTKVATAAPLIAREHKGKRGGASNWLLV